MHTKKDRLSEERRGTVRHPYKSHISLTTLGNSHNLPNNVAKSADSVDISDTGMRIDISGVALRTGSIIKMQIPMPEVQIKIPILAEVMWLKEKKPEHYQAGLKFFLL